MSTLPKAFFRLKGIHVLYLYGNNLETIPNEIGSLVNLYCLDLGKNNIESLPKSICNLVHLETLNLYGNNLSELPAEIVSLHNLRKINLAGNKNLRLSTEQKKWIHSFDESYQFEEEENNQESVMDIKKEAALDITNKMLAQMIKCDDMVMLKAVKSFSAQLNDFQITEMGAKVLALAFSVQATTDSLAQGKEAAAKSYYNVFIGLDQDIISLGVNDFQKEVMLELSPMIENINNIF